MCPTKQGDRCMIWFLNEKVHDGPIPNLREVRRIILEKIEEYNMKDGPHPSYISLVCKGKKNVYLVELDFYTFKVKNKILIDRVH